MNRSTFYEYLRKKGLSEGTAKKYRDIASRWRKRGISVEDYLDEIRNDNMPSGTAMPILSAAKHWAKYHGYVLDVNLTYEEREGYQGVVMSRNEARQFLDELRNLAEGPQDRTAHRAATVALETGLRGSSIHHLELNHAKQGIYRVRAKGGKLLSAPMTKLAVRTLTNQFMESEDGFPEPKLLRKYWRRLSLRSTNEKCKKSTLHTFRHVFASHLASTGTGLPTIQKLLGHKNLTVTARYLHASDSKIKAAILGMDEEEENA